MMLLFTCCRDPYSLEVMLEGRKLARRTAEGGKKTDNEHLKTLPSPGGFAASRLKSVSGESMNSFSDMGDAESDSSVKSEYQYHSYRRYSLKPPMKLKALCLEEPKEDENYRNERPGMVNGIYSFRRPSDARRSPYLSERKRGDEVKSPSRSPSPTITNANSDSEENRARTRKKSSVPEIIISDGDLKEEEEEKSGENDSVPSITVTNGNSENNKISEENSSAPVITIINSDLEPDDSSQSNIKTTNETSVVSSPTPISKKTAEKDVTAMKVNDYENGTTKTLIAPRNTSLQRSVSDSSQNKKTKSKLSIFKLHKHKTKFKEHRSKSIQPQCTEDNKKDKKQAKKQDKKKLNKS